jgi:hypothetical protein
MVSASEAVVSYEVVLAVQAWRVVKAARGHLFGQPVNLAAGKLLTVASYGEAAIQRLKDQGVALEPV